MATITGTIKTPHSATGAALQVSFTPKNTPKADGANLIDSNVHTVMTDSTGALPAGLTLVQGKYTVQIKSGDTDRGSFDIDVPSGSGTSNINAIIDTSAAEADTSLYVRRVYQSTSGVTISNTSATSLFGTGEGNVALSANYFTDGKRIDVEAEGTITTTGTPGTLTLRLGLSVTLVTLAITLPASLGDQHIRIRGTLVCRSAGAAGTFVGFMSATIGGASNSITEYFVDPAEVESDTSTAYTVTMTGQFSAASQSLAIATAQAVVTP